MQRVEIGDAVDAEHHSLTNFLRKRPTEGSVDFSGYYVVDCGRRVP
jgi:hypothetical protein